MTLSLVRQLNHPRRFLDRLGDCVDDDPMPWRLVKAADMAGLTDFAARLVMAAWDQAAADEEFNPHHHEQLHAALKLMREVCVTDVAEEYDPRLYIALNTWVFAKTMPETPHEYVMLGKSTDWREHLVFHRWIRVWGTRVYRKRFHSYYQEAWVDDHLYWTLPSSNSTIINRRHKDAPQP
jgi:hypothetical protein